MRFTLRGARLVDATTDLPTGDMTIEDGILTAIDEHLADTGRSIDLTGHGCYAWLH